MRSRSALLALLCSPLLLCGEWRAVDAFDESLCVWPAQIYLHFHLMSHPEVSVVSSGVVTGIGRDFFAVYCAEFGIEDRIFLSSIREFEIVRCVGHCCSELSAVLTPSSLSVRCRARVQLWSRPRGGASNSWRRCAIPSHRVQQCQRAPHTNERAR